MGDEKYWPRVQKSLATAAAVYNAYQQVENLRGRFSEWQELRNLKTYYTLTIDDQDMLFDYLTVWLFENQTKDAHMLRAAMWDGQAKFVANVEASSSFPLPSGAIVALNPEKEKKTKSENDWGEMISQREVAYQLQVESKEAFKELQEFVASLPEKYISKEKMEWLYTNNKGRFQAISRQLVKRDIDTIHLDEGIKESITADIDLFLAEKDTYVNFGIPWHRGYLLHGKPGTGKTSIVRALSTKYNMSIYSMSLNDIESDGDINSLMGQVDSNSILLIEDIDTFGIANSRTETNTATTKGLSVSGLLNALDGIQTLHGCIIIITSNHPDQLDEALLRPGRIDQKIEIGYLTTFQLTNMIKAFTGEDHVIDVNEEIAPAAVIEIFKSNIRTPEMVIPAIKELVS